MRRKVFDKISNSTSSPLKIMEGGRVRSKGTDAVVTKDREPLQDLIISLRQQSFSLFVSNLHEEISKIELETMFCKAGRIVDSFIPIDRSSGKTRGFGFVRFGMEKEELAAIDMAKGRSWGGRRIVVSIARHGILKHSIRPLGKPPDGPNKVTNPWLNPSKAAVSNTGESRCEGWTIQVGSQAIQVGPSKWVVEEEKRALRCYLVGFLRHKAEGVRAVESLLAFFWGKMAARMKMLDEEAVVMQFPSEKEVEEVLIYADRSSSPFLALDRWMQVIGAPPSPRWVRILGVPLHAWRVGVFRLLGDCIGQTLEVDQATISEVLTHGRVKVRLRKVRRLPVQIPLLVGDLQISVRVEEEQSSP